MPGNLSSHDIQQGKTKRRNPVLSEHAAHLLPSRGLGALQAWPQIELQDHQSGNEFDAVIARPKSPAQVISFSGIGSYSATDPVTPRVKKLLKLLAEQFEMSNNEIRAALEINDRRHVCRSYIAPALEAGFIEPTIPDKPNSRLQRYRLTPSGQQQVQQLKTPDKP